VDADTQYSGADFALSNQSCSVGQVVSGVDASGNVTCETKNVGIYSFVCGGCDLRDISLPGADLSNAWLRRATLSPADLTGANLTSAKLKVLLGFQLWEPGAYLAGGLV